MITWIIYRSLLYLPHMWPSTVWDFFDITYSHPPWRGSDELNSHNWYISKPCRKRRKLNILHMRKRHAHTYPQIHPSHRTKKALVASNFTGTALAEEAHRSGTPPPGSEDHIPRRT